MAFTAAKGIPNLDLKWCFSPESGLPAPDVVVQLDLPLEVARTRGEYGAERYETDELQEKVRHNFKRLHAAATQNGHKWHVVDASRDIDAVTADVLRIAELTVMEAGFTQLRYFSDSDISTLARLQDETGRAQCGHRQVICRHLVDGTRSPAFTRTGPIRLKSLL